jgi:hypothetical protein
VAADSDFAVLWGSAALGEIERRLQANREPVVSGIVAFTLAQPDLLTEGIAYDPGQAGILLGSVRHRRILRVPPKGQASTLGDSW